MSNFQEYEGARFTVADVEMYLLELGKKGWLAKAKKGNRGYVLEPNIDSKIDILHYPSDNRWIIQVSPCIDGKLPFDEDRILNTMEHFKECIVKAADYLDLNLNVPPYSFRLESEKPATNRVKLAQMASMSEVEAIFDPYFDNKAIAELMTLIKLGMNITKTIRVLTTKKGGKNLSEGMLDSFGKEFDSSLDIRILTEKVHRRFMLLSNREVLIIGPSLNSIDHDEILFREESVQDATFFNDNWNKSSNIAL
jgi:hypothetical protein